MAQAKRAMIWLRMKRMLGATQGAIEPHPATVERWLMYEEAMFRTFGRRATWTSSFSVNGVSRRTRAISFWKEVGSHSGFNTRWLKVTRCWLTLLAFMMFVLPATAIPEVELRRRQENNLNHYHASGQLSDIQMTRGFCYLTIYKFPSLRFMSIWSIVEYMRKLRHTATWNPPWWRINPGGHASLWIT